MSGCACALLNAATARPFAVRIDRHRAMVMAIDGQPAQPFEARGARVILGPGNRADLFVDCTLSPGVTASILVETAGRSRHRSAPGLRQRQRPLLAAPGTKAAPGQCSPGTH